MKHALLSLSCIAIALSGCTSAPEPKKDIPTTPGGRLEEIEILEILPEKETKSNSRLWEKSGQREQIETPKTAPTTTPTPSAEMPEKDADQVLIQTIRRSLADDAILARYISIKIASKNGDVILRGVVESPQEKEALEKKIRAIRGVKTLDNRLQLIPDPTANATQANRF